MVKSEDDELTNPTLTLYKLLLNTSKVSFGSETGIRLCSENIIT